MSPIKAAVTPLEIYDQALKYSREFRLLPDQPRPCFTSEWLEENRVLLERYTAWLSSGGFSAAVIRSIYIPVAGHVLGLNRKPASQLDLDADLNKAMDYILAKGHGPSWTHNCRLSLQKFRRFLLHERGLVECKTKHYDPALHAGSLPGWLVESLTRFQRVQQRNWREARIEENIRRFWCGHLRLWRFLCGECQVQEISDLKRTHFMRYIDSRLANKVSVCGINGDLRSFHGFMAFLQEQGMGIAHALFHIHCLKEPEPLPRFLTDDQIRALRDDLELRVKNADNATHLRDALLDRACFYLLWQSGLRRGEVEDLRLEDIDLQVARLTVRRGKGMLDRTVYLTPSVVRALSAYLAVRGMGPTSHVFLYRNQPLSKDLISGRLKACGARVGVPVFAHRLRHTCATQLLNAGCRITSIQKFLGHKRLNTTLTYARAHDQTVCADYFTAMGSVEKRLELLGEVEEKPEPISAGERVQLLVLAEKLAQADLSVDLRLEIANRIRCVLRVPERPMWVQPPPSPVLLE
jgi:integrase